MAAKKSAMEHLSRDKTPLKHFKKLANFVFKNKSK